MKGTDRKIHSVIALGSSAALVFFSITVPGPLASLTNGSKGIADQDFSRQPQFNPTWESPFVVC